MKREFLTSDKIFIQPTKFADILLESSGYSDLHDRLTQSDLEYSDAKVHEVAPSGFVDFNQHLYTDINHMNSVSCGIYIENSLVTFRIFIWGSKGEGFEIFKHVLLGEEIKALKSVDDIKAYIHKHLQELEDGILKTYGDDAKYAFEQFGMGIESKKLPLPSILQFMSINNNIADFR